MAKRLHKGAFPQGEAHQIEPAPARGGLLLASDDGQYLLHFTALTQHGIQITWVADQRRRDQLSQRDVDAASLALLAVVGQAPAGVKWHAEAIDRLAEQQGLKSELGRDGVDRLHHLEQGMGMAVIGDDLHISQL
ncbi:hypothetical protein D3C79_706380 [compost metagenome]